MAITDAIPFYDIGSVVQRISGLCSETVGCILPDEEPSDAAAANDATAPSDGDGGMNIGSGSAFDSGTLVSEVELIIGRNFGFPAAQSLMTTTCTAKELVEASLPGAPSGDSVINVELRVETTAAKQSSIAALLPGLDEMLKFPSGDALDMVSPKSASVILANTYLNRETGLRIARPVLKLDGAQGFMGEEESMPLFVYAKM